jgi:transposase IS116/IS110/IS902 family protein
LLQPEQCDKDRASPKNTVLQLGDRVRHLHQAVDLTFPEFTRYVRGLDTELATTILSRYPTTAALRRTSPKKLAILCFDGRRRIEATLALALIGAAKISVGQHRDQPYELQVRYACDDIVTLRQRARDLEREIERKLDAHEVGKLLTSIEGVGPLTAACIIGETGDPARFRSAAALASYVGVVPVCTSPENANSRGESQSRLETRDSGARCGCPCWSRFVSILGCALTIGTCVESANGQRSR